MPRTVDTNRVSGIMGANNIVGFYNQLKVTGALFTHQFLFNLYGGGISKLRDLENITYYAKGNKIPKTAIKEDKVKYMGVEFKVPTVAEQDSELTMTIVADGAHRIQAAFKEWFKDSSNWDIEGGTIGQGSKVPSDVKGVLTVLNEKMQPNGKYELNGIFPLKVGDVKVSYENANLAEFTVTLKFQYYQFIP